MSDVTTTQQAQAQRFQNEYFSSLSKLEVFRFLAGFCDGFHLPPDRAGKPSSGRLSTVADMPPGSREETAPAHRREGREYSCTPCGLRVSYRQRGSLRRQRQFPHRRVPSPSWFYKLPAKGKRGICFNMADSFPTGQKGIRHNQHEAAPPTK